MSFYFITIVLLRAMTLQNSRWHYLHGTPCNRIPEILQVCSLASALHFPVILFFWYSNVFIIKKDKDYLIMSSYVVIFEYMHCYSLTIFFNRNAWYNEGIIFIIIDLDRLYFMWVSQDFIVGIIKYLFKKREYWDW